MVATDLSGPCSEGGFAVYGTQLISTDAASWTALPFGTGTPGESRSGASVNAAAVAGGSLLVAGEMDGVAMFWIGEAP